MDGFTLNRRVAVAGVGESTYHKRGQSPDDEVGLALTAIRAAAADAGLDPSEIDGFASYSNDGLDPVRMMPALGIPELRFTNMVWGGGGGGVCAAVANAGAAVVAGLAEVVVVVRSLAQGDFRFGRAFEQAGSRALTGVLGLVVPYGMMSPAQTVALRTRRFMHEHGVGQDALAAIALTSYEHAQHNPRAVMNGRPLSREAYDESRWIVEPFHLFDCCQENDGAAAVIVTSAERARDLRQPPAYVLAAEQGTSVGFDLFDHFSDPYATSNFTSTALHLFEAAGVEPADVDVAQVYENFTGAVLMSIVEHGLCEPEEISEVFTPENLRWTGSLPLNTSGGNLAECYVHGLGLVVEGVRQVRGQATLQVPDVEVSLVAGGPATAPVSSLLLGR